MAIYSFSALADEETVAFDAALDTLRFDSAAIPAAAVRITETSTGVGFTSGGKTVWLDGLDLRQVTATSITFADGSRFVVGDGTSDGVRDAYGKTYDFTTATKSVQAWGLEGADLVRTGSAADWLVGNDPLTRLEHVARDGATGAPTASSSATISADGRFVAFAGGWTQFGSSSNSSTDVLVKDMTTGVVVNEHEDANGVNGLSGSGSPVLSADGRWLAFVSSSALVPGGPPSGTLYLASTTGNAIQAVSTTSGNGAYADRGASLPDVSADGRWVVFSSAATNLAAGSTSTFVDVFLKDVTTGDVTRLSTSTAGGDGNGESGYLGNAAHTGAKISAGGSLVVFQSEASNLTAGDTNGYSDVFLWRASTGQLTNLTSTLAAVSNPNNGNSRPDVALNAAGQAIVVFETARNLVAADTSNGTDIYALNVATGALTLVSSTAAGAGVQGSSGDASISDDGRWVVFTSSSSTLVAGDGNGVADVFVKDLATGAIALVSRSATGVAGTLASGNAAISSGGDWIVFESSAPNLASSDANGSLADVFRVSNPLLKDTLVGGAGNDSYVLARNDVVQEAAGGGTDTVLASISYTLGANLENLTLTGSANLSGTGNSLNNVITGNAGNNALNGSSGTDTVSFANATGAVVVDLALGTATGFGSDTLANFEYVVGSAFNDRITGNALANRLDGGLGADTMTGGLGDDTYVADANTDIVVEAAASGIDTVISAVTWTLGGTLEHLTLSGSAPINGTGNNAANRITGNGAANKLEGGGNDDTLAGGLGNDSLVGGAGNDRLDGNAGSDTMVGGLGDDSYVADANTDIVVEAVNAGIDTVTSAVTWTLAGTLEHLTLSGSAAINGSGNNAANRITGNGAANLLAGVSGDDTVSGGLGNDTLTGGSGSDSLSGGTGADRFQLDSLVGSDRITDFAGGSDKIFVRMSSVAIGDGDTTVEGARTRAAPGGFLATDELVIFSNNAAALTTAGAAAAIGSATTGFAVGRKALFVVDDGTSSAVFRFVAADTDAAVEAGELTLLAVLAGTPATGIADFLFGA